MNTEQQFFLIDMAQRNFARLLDGLTLQQINKVPDGFRNNLVWNFGHVVASLQMLCYGRPGLSLRLNEAFVHSYKVGTKPEKFVTAEEYDLIKQLASQGLDALRDDYNNGYFKDFKPYVTMTGIPIDNIDFAIRYVGVHHGIHQGYSTALKNLVV
jgi:hypothetical protein